MTIHIFNKHETHEMLKKLNEQFGINEIPGSIVMKGSERMFFYTGSFGKDEIEAIETKIFIERIGIYLGKIEEGGIRLSIEGTQILGSQITKNFFEISEEQAEQWMKGHELNVKTGLRGFVVIKCKSDFLGTGKASEEKIGNFIPKNRRLREKS